jgi:hypothetical protein
MDHARRMETFDNRGQLGISGPKVGEVIDDGDYCVDIIRNFVNSYSSCMKQRTGFGTYRR